MLWVFFGSYQYPENPQVDPVVLVQPLAVDLEPLAGKKQDHVVGERHERGGDESREQQPGSVHTEEEEKKNQLSISLSEIKGLLIEASHSLSVKEEQPGGVQGHVDDGGDVKAVGQHGGSGVQPVVGAPAGGGYCQLTAKSYLYMYTLPVKSFF